MQEEILLRTDDVSATVLGLAVGEEVPWHHHSEITDHIVCLEGAIEVSVRSPEEKVVLNPGQRHTVVNLCVHRVVNVGSGAAKYLIVQGIGKYDRIMGDV